MRNYTGLALMIFTTMAAAAGCYTINLKVSAERSGIETLRRQLVVDARSMRDLQAELRTRARLPEMQRWNDQVLKMSAPAAGQFMRSPVQLASFVTGPAVEGAGPGIAPATAPAVRYAVTAPVPVAPAGTAGVVRTAYSPQHGPDATKAAKAQALADALSDSLAADDSVVATSRGNPDGGQ